MKQDFEEQVKHMSGSATPPKNGDFTQQAKDILNSAETPANGDFTGGQEASIKSVEAREEVIQEPVQNRTDYQTAVNPTTGSISETDAPRDSTTQSQSATNTASNTAGQAGNTASAQQVPQQPGAAPVAPVPNRQEALLTPTSEFEGKRRGFFNPDTEKGFFDTLDKKMQEALRGNSPDEIAQNMFFAALTMICEMVANACDNDRKEFKRLKEEYLKRVAEHDGPNGVGVSQAHKNLMFWSVVATHPSMQQYIGKPITKEVRESALNLIKTDKDVQGAFKGIVSAACGREVKNSELDDFIKKALKVKTGGNTLGDIQNRGLNDEVVQRGVNLSGPKGHLPTLHQKWAQHAEEVRAHNARRADLCQRRTHRRPTRTQDQVRTAENSRS